MTCPLITNRRNKIRKIRGGNVWLTADKTSVYKFYQFWMNTTDVDAEKYIKIFTFLDKETIEIWLKIIKQLLIWGLYKKSWLRLTVFVHSEKIWKNDQSICYFIWNATDDLKELDEATFLEVLMECLKLKKRSEGELTLLQFWMKDSFL
jgi:tyrosyl-tRNA synthetase